MIIVEEGDYHLKGETDFIYYSAISGGLYDDPSLKEIVHMEDSLEIIRTRYRKIVDEARKKGDMEKAKEYVDKFNRFHSNHQESYALLQRKTKELVANQSIIYLGDSGISSKSFICCSGRNEICAVEHGPRGPE